jgi:hypothetical protein
MSAIRVEDDPSPVFADHEGVPGEEHESPGCRIFTRSSGPFAPHRIDHARFEVQLRHQVLEQVRDKEPVARYGRSGDQKDQVCRSS